MKIWNLWILKGETERGNSLGIPSFLWLQMIKSRLPLHIPMFSLRLCFYQTRMEEDIIISQQTCCSVCFQLHLISIQYEIWQNRLWASLTFTTCKNNLKKENEQQMTSCAYFPKGLLLHFIHPLYLITPSLFPFAFSLPASFTSSEHHIKCCF